MTFYTYLHRRESDNAVFYVGKGKGERAWSHKGRNSYWQRVAKKHGAVVEICQKFETESEAFDHERFLVASFKAVGSRLANLTDGGEGPSGFKFTDEMKQRQRKATSEALAAPDVKARQKAGIAAAWQDPEKRKRIVAAQRESLATPTRSATKKAAANAVWSNPVLRKEQSERVRAIWADPVKRAKMLEARKKKSLNQ